MPPNNVFYYTSKGTVRNKWGNLLKKYFVNTKNHKKIIYIIVMWINPYSYYSVKGLLGMLLDEIAGKFLMRLLYTGTSTFGVIIRVNKWVGFS